MNFRDNETLIRRILGILLPSVFIILTMLPFFLFRERLPDPVAVHWGTDGRPNGFMQLSFMVIFNLVFVGIPAVVMFFSSRRKPAYKGAMSHVMSVLAFICTLATCISWLTVYNNLDASDWTGAAMKGGLLAGLITQAVVSCLMAGLAFWLGRLIELPEQPVPALPSANLKPDDRAVWIGTARSMWGLPLLVGCMGLGIFFLIRQFYPPALIVILAGIVCIPFMSIRVLANNSGVHLSFGPISWPKRYVPLKDILQARAIDVIPMQHGGWGYRPSIKHWGNLSIILRGGEGLELVLDGNKKLVVTVDGATEGAGLINDLISRA
jgi:uncharacterized membrane protein